MSELSSGVLVGSRFRLVKELGGGSYGTVWSAVDVARGGAPVALKVLREELREHERPVARFEREAQLYTALDHPRITRAYAFDLEGEVAYIAMELVEGRVLSDVLSAVAAEGAVLPREVELVIAEQLGDAVEYAHSRGLVHRDLKPRNVMVEEREGAPAVKLLDLGIAKLMDASFTSATTLGRKLGALFYMSPEQARGEEIDARTDIFALGATMFEVLTLHRAWASDREGRRVSVLAKPVLEANGREAVAERLARAPRPRASEHRPELGVAVDRVLARAMAIDPRDRWPSAAEFSRALGDALGEAGPSERPPTRIWRRPEVAVPRKKKRGSRWVAQLAVLAAVGAGGWLIGRSGRETPVVSTQTPVPQIRAEPTVSARPVVRPVDEERPAPEPPRKLRAAKSAAVKRDEPRPEINPLDALVQRIKDDPTDVRALSELRRRLLDIAKTLEEGTLRTSIERRATAGGAVGDASSLEACVEDLRKAGAL